MKIELEDMDVIDISDHSDNEEIISIERDGNKFNVSINTKYKNQVKIDEFTIDKI